MPVPAVIDVIVSLPLTTSDLVKPALKVAFKLVGYFNITIPLPPLPPFAEIDELPLTLEAPPPPPPPVLACPFNPEKVCTTEYDSVI